MANKSGTQFKAVLDNIREAVNELQLESLPEIAELVRSRIQTFAKSGKTMVKGQPNEPRLKILSDNYVAERKKWKKEGRKTGDLFSPSRSNLTASGQFLDSIQTKKIEKKTATITIAATGTRSGESLSNQQLAKYLSEQGRSIWAIDDATKKRIINIVKTDIRNAIKKKILNK